MTGFCFGVIVAEIANFLFPIYTKGGSPTETTAFMLIVGFVLICMVLLREVEPF